MQKITLLGVLGMLCLQHNVHAQKIDITPFFIGDRVPDLPLKNIINYKDTVATLSSFGNKIIILDFWNIHCTSCVQLFPLEDSLQQEFGDKIQFILVTQDLPERTQNFINAWNSLNGKKLSMPVVAGDRLLGKLFRYRYIPHFVWIASNGQILAQASDTFISGESIAQALRSDSAIKASLITNQYSGDAYSYPVLSKEMSALIQQIENQN